MDDDSDSERGSYGIDGDVIMRRPDSTGREKIIISGSKLVDRGRDLRLDIRHDPHFGETDPLLVQPCRDLRDILVLSPTGQDLIADHQQRSRPNSFVAHTNSVGLIPSYAYMARMAEYITVGVDDRVEARNGVIKLHGPEGFEGMRRAGRLAAEILDALVPHVVPGVTTGELDDIVREHMLREGAVPATLNYRGYTKSCCTSINHVVCHGIPEDRKLKDGDIINIDVTPIVDGWHGDTSRMYLVGDVPLKARKLVDITYECLMLGIEQAKPGNRLGDIAAAIQRHAEARRYTVVRDFCGHGLGRLFHDSPEVVHAGRPGTGPELKQGMFFTVEPMINIGRPDVKLLDDGWTAVTRDRSLSAQFEHSIGITEDGCEIFTKSPAGLDNPPYA